MSARPLPVPQPRRVVLPPTTAALLRLWPNERDIEVIRRALLLLGTADGVLDGAGRPKRPGPKGAAR